MNSLLLSRRKTFLPRNFATHLQFRCGHDFHQLIRIIEQPLALLTVHLLVPLVPPPIIDRFTTNRHKQHETLKKPKPHSQAHHFSRSTHQRAPIRVQIPDPYVRHELARRHHQKVQIQEELELLVQHQRQERYDVVLLVADGVGRELPRRGPPQVDGAGAQLPRAAASPPQRAPAAETRKFRYGNPKHWLGLSDSARIT